jgi:hypothetical protein
MQVCLLTPPEFRQGPKVRVLPFPGKRVRSRTSRILWLDIGLEKRIEGHRMGQTAMPGPFDIEIRQLFEIEDFAEDNVKT